MNDTHNAFVEVFTNPRSEDTSGPLGGLTFAVKDNFCISDTTVGLGNPVWARSRLPEPKTAPTVSRLIHDGATLVGKTKMDEFAFSMSGENVHYDTPINPCAPDRTPGGSSSGSAVAVSASLVDFALGTDTAGSVRLPASFCGIFGFRPTYDRSLTEGVIPLAPSFDTVGWFARSVDVMERVTKSLLPSSTSSNLESILFLDGAFSMVEPNVHPIFKQVQNDLQKHVSSAATAEFKEPEWEETVNLFKTIQSYEAWQCHGKWLSSTDPQLGPGIKERFQFGSTVTGGEVEEAQRKRDVLKSQFMKHFERSELLCIPTTPGFAPLKGQSPVEADRFRQKALRLLVLANLFGLPQINIPIITKNHPPLGISFLARPYHDLALVQASKMFAKALSS